MRPWAYLERNKITIYSPKRFRPILSLVVLLVASGLILFFSATTALSAEQDQTTPPTAAQEETTDEELEKLDLELSGGGAAASNPLSSVDNTDLKWTYFNLNDRNNSRRVNYWIKGGWTFASWGKLSYELTYQETNITGSSEHDWESLRLKPIFFIKSGQLGTWRYRLATGFEWILDFDNRDKGIGSGSDQIAPLFGVALLPRKGTTLVPLVQHFINYNGDTINTTGFRFIGIQSFPYNIWSKIDLIVPYDWENEKVPATVEVELGKMSTSFFGIYVSGLAGIGGDRTIDWGGSLNLRFVY